MEVPRGTQVQFGHEESHIVVRDSFLVLKFNFNLWQAMNTGIQLPTACIKRKPRRLIYIHGQIMSTPKLAKRMHKYCMKKIKMATWKKK